MGSRPPASTSPCLVLAHPTPGERAHITSLTHSMWGEALQHADYVRREEFLTTVPLARDGGITHWILTEDGATPDARTIFASCESLRKAAVVALPGLTPPGSTGQEHHHHHHQREEEQQQQQQEAVPAAGPRLVSGSAHAIASVFTDPALRGQGYASRMMAELGAVLRAWQTPPPALCSVLYSDVGPHFYARAGWTPMASTHLSFPPWVAPPSGPASATATAAATATATATATPLGCDDLAPLCAADEQLVTAAALKRTRATRRPTMAILPRLDAMLWHLERETFVAEHVLGRTPAVRGAVVNRDRPGERVWAVFARNYHGSIEKDANILHVLRLVFENADDEEGLVDAVKAIIQLAQREAVEWHCKDVQLWNPSPETRRAVEKTGIKFHVVERDKESIPSLMWYGEGSSADVDWLANEKYAWC